MLAAVLLGFGDDPVAHVDVIQGKVVGAAAEPFVDGVAGLDVPIGQAGGPAPVAVAESTLEAGLDAEDVAAHQVQALSGFRDLVQLRHIQRRGAVEAVEVGRLVAEPRDRGRHADAGDDVLAVKEGVKHGISLGIAGNLHVGLPDIVRINGAVSILIDIRKGAVMPAQVGGIADGGQRAEVDTGFLDFFLGGSGKRGCKQDRGGEQMFHSSHNVVTKVYKDRQILVKSPFLDYICLISDNKRIYEQVHPCAGPGHQFLPRHRL